MPSKGHWLITRQPQPHGEWGLVGPWGSHGAPITSKTRLFITCAACSEPRPPAFPVRAAPPPLLWDPVPMSPHASITAFTFCHKSEGPRSSSVATEAQMGPQQLYSTIHGTHGTSIAQYCRRTFCVPGVSLCWQVLANVVLYAYQHALRADRDGCATPVENHSSGNAWIPPRRVAFHTVCTYIQYMATRPRIARPTFGRQNRHDRA